MKQFKVEYQAGCVTSQGHFFMIDSSEKKPTLVLAPYWKGPDHIGQNTARMIVDKFGWNVFLADYYGNGILPESDEEAAQKAGKLFQDRHELRLRMQAALDTATQQPGVDGKKMGAIGFCLGGLATIELYKSGAPLLGAVSFHGLLGTQMGSIHAKMEPRAKQIPGALLVLHGYLDPLVSQEDIIQFENEMAQAKVDWQMHIYGTAGHAFTNPDAKSKDSGLFYNEKVSNRAFQAMENFFRDLFN